MKMSTNCAEKSTGSYEKHKVQFLFTLYRVCRWNHNSNQDIQVLISPLFRLPLFCWLAWWWKDGKYSGMVHHGHNLITEQMKTLAISAWEAPTQMTAWSLKTEVNIYLQCKRLVWRHLWDWCSWWWWMQKMEPIKNDELHKKNSQIKKKITFSLKMY